MAAVAVLATAACTTDTKTPEAEPAPSSTDQGSTGTPAHACEPELDKALSAWADAGFSGSITVMTGGEADCVAAYGMADSEAETPNTVDTVFAIGSVSKAFTAAAVLGLVADGALALDDRAGDVLTELDGPVADATIEQLLLHTSGLTGSHGDDYEPLGRDAAIEAIGGLESAFEPGTDYAYSNAGYTLLALIVEHVSGTDYREYMATRLLSRPSGEVTGGFWDGEPAAPGPRAVGYLDGGRTDQMGDFDGPHWAVAGNGDLAMTTEQLATWTNALFTGGVLSAEATELIGTAVFDHGDGTSEMPGWVAFDESAFGTPFLASAGGGGDVGHNVVVVWVPETEQVITIASNTPDITAEQLVQKIGPSLIAGEPLPEPEGSSRDTGSPDSDSSTDGDGSSDGDGSTDEDGSPSRTDPADVAGTYRLETGGSFSARERDDGLEISAIGADAVAALFPVSGRFTADDVAAHEQAVLSLLAGETQEGREELELLESDLGPVDDVELAGTITAEGELRTYVTVVTGSETFMLWYALDEHGGIGAVDGPAEPPAVTLRAGDDGRFRPDDPTGTGPEVTVAFDGGSMTITGPHGTTTVADNASEPTD
ncbi:serine hydrolase domain-containing protein [Phytoactinopolyspora halotolerans]|uniref:Beta-lactamase family protein n=1 Tax=Phytoactinopolyspora halotolerans TaxID=1981512 RepID=A0A6L9S598_9ACTN|nr:serine hydrolase domain-containing protein [Phytoactinopolyspora halotolerans]NED99920.1 beta-lactamase family protein [Phytoactinopolyspora halotolerans]